MSDLTMMIDGFMMACMRIEQPCANSEENARQGDWYLKLYDTSGEYPTYAIMEKIVHERTGEEDTKISTDLSLEEWLLALQAIDLFLTQYNENIQ